MLNRHTCRSNDRCKLGRSVSSGRGRCEITVPQFCNHSARCCTRAEESWSGSLPVYRRFSIRKDVVARLHDWRAWSLLSRLCIVLYRCKDVAKSMPCTWMRPARFLPGLAAFAYTRVLMETRSDSDRDSPLVVCRVLCRKSCVRQKVI